MDFVALPFYYLAVTGGEMGTDECKGTTHYKLGFTYYNYNPVLYN